jgi:peptidyl-tRNA hydrolase
MDTKQIIIMRKDLNMRKGKMISQACHSTLKLYLDLCKIGGEGWELISLQRIYKNLNKKTNESISFNFVTEYMFKRKKIDISNTLLTD